MGREGGNEASSVMEETKRMWIDVRPPERPEKGDCWIRMGELRTWDGFDWNPPWLPPQVTMPPGYPKAGPRKGRPRRKKVSDEERESGELYEEWLSRRDLSDSPKE